MKLSLMTFMCEIPLIMEGEWTDEKTARVEEVIRQVSETGFTAIDITDNTVNFIGRERIKDLLAGLGLEVASLICFYRLSDPFISDEEAIEPYLQGIKDAKYLGCKHLMLVPGIAPPEADTESMTKAMIRRNRMIVQEAEKEGIACMVEDDPDITKGMCSLKDLKSMLDAVPGLKVVFDSANMYPAGEQTVPYYEALSEYVIHTHIKDIAVADEESVYTDRGVDGTLFMSVPHGTGMVDFEELFRSLYKHGYDGYLAIEYVPAPGVSLKDDLKRVYRMFASYVCRLSPGANQFCLLGKLMANPQEEVWKEVKKRGLGSIEVCILPDHSERVLEYQKVMAEKFNAKEPPRLPKWGEINDFVKGIRAAGLDVFSFHVMMADAYPSLIVECVPYIKEVAANTGVKHFVISCMFDSAEKTSEFLPYMQEAAHALRESGIALCYHDHDMDCIPFENGKSAMQMILEQCPDCMFQLDIGWAWYGKMDSLAFMRENGERITSIHLKDFAPDARERTDNGKFTAVGSGAAPTREVLENLTLIDIAPGRLIIDQDASDNDMYDEIESGVRFVRL